MQLTLALPVLKFAAGGCMKDIHEVLRQKQAKYAQLGKQIEMLQQAAEKLREVAPLLTDTDEDESAVLPELEETPAQPMAAKAAGAGGAGPPGPAPRGVNAPAPP